LSQVGRLSSLFRRWWLGGFRLGGEWLAEWFEGPPPKDTPMFPKVKLTFDQLESRYHPNDPMGLLNTQVLGFLVAAGLDLSPAVTALMRRDSSAAPGVIRSASIDTTEVDLAGMGFWDAPKSRLPQLPETGGSGGTPSGLNLYQDPPWHGAESSQWAMGGSDLWVDPFAAAPGLGSHATEFAGGVPGNTGGSVSSASSAGLSGLIVNPVTGSATGGVPIAAGSSGSDSSGPTGPSTGGGGYSPPSPLTSGLPSTGSNSGVGPLSPLPPILPPHGGGGGGGGGKPPPIRLGASSGNGIFEFSIGSLGHIPYEAFNIVSGPDGNLWATTNHLLDGVAKITPTGTVTDIGAGLSVGNDIVSGPDGNLWFTGQPASTAPGGGVVGKVTTSGTVTKWTLSNTASPAGITVGADGNLWFAEPDNSTIAKITTGGTLTEYSIPTANSIPEDVTLGVDGNVWFTESATNKIGKVTTSGSFTEYTVPTSNSTPWGIATGPDGNVWFTENTGNNIGRITVGGTFTEFSIPTTGSSPKDIQAGPDGGLWFMENGTNKVGNITPSGSIAEYSPPSSGSGPNGIGTGPDGNVWFTESSVGNVAKLTNVIGTGGHLPAPNPIPDPVVDGTSTDYSQQTTVPIGEFIWAQGGGDVNIVHNVNIAQSPGGCSCGVGRDEVSAPVADVYHSDSNNPQPIVALTFSTDPNGTVPSSITARLNWNGANQSLVTFSTTGHAKGDTYLLGMQVNSAVTVTSAYPWTITATAAYSGGVSVVRTLSGTQLVVANGSSSPEGPGWSLATVDKLVTVGSDLLWVYGAGESRLFKSVGGNNYLSPPNDFGTLVKNVNGSFTYTAKDQTQLNFNSSGQITSIVNPEGLTRSYTYSSGLLNTITLPDGGVGTFNYTSGLLTSINEPGSRTVTLAYTSGYLTSIQDPDGSLQTFSYDANHRLNNVQHGPLNATVGYDTTSGLANSINQGLAVAWTLAPAAAVGLATSPAKNSSQSVGVLTDALSHATSYTLDNLGRETKVVTADGAAQAWQLDFAGQVKTQTDGLGNLTSFTYDYSTTGKGDLTQINHADGSTEQFQYDGTFHHMTVQVDGNGNRTTMAYDATTGDLTTMTNALNQTTTYAYYQTGGHDNGLVLSTTDPLGHITSYAYDSSRRVTQEIGAYSTSVATSATMIYDTFGNLLSETTGISSTAAYDHHTTTSYTLDAMRRQMQVIEAYGTALQRTTSTVYDGIGDVLYTTDPLGHITSFAYDQLARQTTQISGYGTSVATTATMIYDNAGNLLSETTGQSTTSSYAHASTTSYGYDAVNRQNQVISGYGAAEASTATMIYDLSGNLLSETDGYSSRSTYAHATTTSYGYDAMNRQNKVITAFGTAVAVTATMTFDLAGNLKSETTGQSTTSSYAHASTSSYSYDALNRQISVTEAVGVTGVQRTSSTAFDAAGNVLSTTDALGQIASYAYDALNRQTTQIDGYGSQFAVTATMSYDAAGNLLSETTGQSTTSSYAHVVTTSLAYDALNRQTGQTVGVGDQFAVWSTMSYDAGSNLISETTGQSTTASYAHTSTTSFGYDALDRRTGETDAVGVTGVQRSVTNVYDAAGNVVARIDALGNATTSTYDALNRVIAVQNPNPSGTATTVYDAASNVINTIDANGNNATFTYDALNRQTASTDPLGKTTTNTFDAAGNRLTLTDPDNNTTTFAFDALNRLTQQTDALNHSASFAYNADDQVTSTTDRNGRLRTISYDALNRETGETWKTSATGSIVNIQTFTYDAAGNQLTATDTYGAYTMAYDVQNRMTSEQEPYGQALTFTYDAAGNRLTRTDSQSGVATETYDALNRLVTYQYSAGTVTMSLAQTWTKRDQLNTESRYSDLSGTHLVGTTSYGYDNAGRETSLQFKDGSGNNISYFTYSYDAGDRLTADTLAVATLAASTTSYQYDADNQLTQSGTLTYGYDANGNRNNTGYTTGTENQLTNDGTWTYTYDSEGALIQKSKGTNLDTWTYAYDNLNRLTSATEKNAGATVQQLTYKYDVSGNRIDMEVTISGTTTATHFAYDGDNAWEDLNGSNVLQTRRLYTDATDALFARVVGSTAAWYLTDRLGSVRDVANNTTGGSIDHIDYDGFGNVTNETNSANGDRYKYTAREFDSQTGLQYNRARYYDPKAGRWMSQDPEGFDARDANLYRFVRNSPTDLIDQEGLQDNNIRPQVWYPHGKVSDGPIVNWIYGFKAEVTKDKELKFSLFVNLHPTTESAEAKLTPELFAQWEGAIKKQFNNWRLVNPHCDSLDIVFDVHFEKDEPRPHSMTQEVTVVYDHIRGSMLKWMILDPRFSRPPYRGVVHEIGHMFGLKDEYVDQDLYPNKGPNDLPADAADSIMNNTERGSILQRHISIITFVRAHARQYIGSDWTLVPK
jgi:RHS repeat-associated protein